MADISLDKVDIGVEGVAPLVVPPARKMTYEYEKPTADGGKLTYKIFNVVEWEADLASGTVKIKYITAQGTEKLVNETFANMISMVLKYP